MFRIGTTSYILPDHILPNVEYLAPLVDDVELVLFETDEHGSNLPDAAVRERLAELASTYGLTYTVHLPLDVYPGDGREECLVKAARVIEATREVHPFAYIAHLDGRRFADLGGVAPDPRELEAWREGSSRALRTICRWIGEPSLLCIENVETWDPELFAPILDTLAVSRAADVGHLWLRGEDGAAVLDAWAERTRVVHLHGIAGRDHASLRHVRRELLDPVVSLLAQRFTGVLTLEVFNQADFHSSLEELRGALERASRGGSRG